jgi:mevalonate kinase
MHRTIKASAPGRVCFAGEDIDWISGPAILGAIGLRIEVTVANLPPDCDLIELESGTPFSVKRRISLKSLGCYQGHPLDYVEAAIKVLSAWGAQITPVRVSVSSSLPASVGLSSSAALAVASLAALAKLFRLNLSDIEVCGLAYIVESEELRTGAGQMDFYVCGLGGFMYIDSHNRPPHPIEKYGFPAGMGILIADTMVPRSTADVIRTKRSRLQSAEAGIISYIEHTEKAIADIRGLLQQPELDIDHFGVLISSCHRYLNRYMRVSTDLLNKCVETSLNKGAVGAKLTGTGMGGCMFALAPLSKMREISEALSSLPVLTYATNISNTGIVIES